ncbi:MAG: hypothetical protein Q8N63_04950 [Nanoarchaeota archaeon]|nr:hypothetical protein [Nanoarchaeota archaeon]
MKTEKLTSAIREAVAGISKIKPSSPCLSDDVLERITTGKSLAFERRYVEEHIDACAKCCGDLAVYFKLERTNYQK